MHAKLSSIGQSLKKKISVNDLWNVTSCIGTFSCETAILSELSPSSPLSGKEGE